MEELVAALRAKNYRAVGFLLPRLLDIGSAVLGLVIELEDLVATAMVVHYLRAANPDGFALAVLDNATSITNLQQILILVAALGQSVIERAAIAALAFYWELYADDPILWHMFARTLDWTAVNYASDYLDEPGIRDAFLNYAEDEEIEEYIEELGASPTLLSSEELRTSPVTTLVEREELTPLSGSSRALLERISEGRSIERSIRSREDVLSHVL